MLVTLKLDESIKYKLIQYHKQIFIPHKGLVACQFLSYWFPKRKFLQLELVLLTSLCIFREVLLVLRKRSHGVQCVNYPD